MHNILELTQNQQTGEINVKKYIWDVSHVKHHFWQKSVLKASYNNLSVLWYLLAILCSKILHQYWKWELSANIKSMCFLMAHINISIRK